MAGSVGEVSLRVGRLSGCQSPHPARFEHFDRVCVAFSSARDSSVLSRPGRDRARSVHAFVRNCPLENVKIDRSILDPNPNFPYPGAGLLVAPVDLCAREPVCGDRRRGRGLCGSALLRGR